MENTPRRLVTGGTYGEGFVVEALPEVKLMAGLARIRIGGQGKNRSGWQFSLTTANTDTIHHGALSTTRKYGQCTVVFQLIAQARHRVIA